MTAIVSASSVHPRASNALAAGNGDLAARLGSRWAAGTLWQRTGSEHGPSTSGRRAVTGWAGRRPNGRRFIGFHYNSGDPLGR